MQTVGLTYNDYVTQIGVLAVQSTQTVGGIVSGVDPQFNTALAQALNYAELRIQRDLDLLPALTGRGYTAASGNNIMSIPVPDFVAIKTISIDGVPLLAVSQEWLQNVYGTPTLSGQPLFFAAIGGDDPGGASNSYVQLGPWPDRDYYAFISGFTRLPSLYTYASDSVNAGSAKTFISTWLPDLLIQASMIYISQYQRNFGPTSNDPQMGPSYESQYQTLLRGAMQEETRKKFQDAGWSSQSAPVLATPGR